MLNNTKYTGLTLETKFYETGHKKPKLQKYKQCTEKIQNNPEEEGEK